MRSTHPAWTIALGVLGIFGAACSTPATPQPPEPPSGLTAHATSATVVELHWSSPARATGFRVRRSTEGGAPELLADVRDTTYTDSSASANTAYTYTVATLEVTRESAPSAPTDVVTPPTLPSATVTPTSTPEDTPFHPGVQLVPSSDHGSERTTVTLTSLPEGFTPSLPITSALSEDQLAALTLTPPPNVAGSFSLSLTLHRTGRSGIEVVSDPLVLPVEVVAVADEPTLTVTDAMGDEDTAIALPVSATLTDLDGSEILSVSITGVPSGATLTGATEGEGGQWSVDDMSRLALTPPLNDDAPITLTVTATTTESSNQDAKSISRTLTITVLPVNDPPVAVDDTASTEEDTPLTITASTLLANDIDVDSSTLSVVAVTALEHGSVQLEAPNVLFVPEMSFSGTSRFQYTVSDGALTATGTVTVQILGVDDPPVAAADSVSTDEDASLVITEASLLSNDFDSDGPEALHIVSAANASHGTVSLSAEGVTFTPESNFNGAAGFDYTITDGQRTATAHVVVTVLPVNDAPTATGDNLSTDEDTPLTIDVATLLANDSDVEGDSLQFEGADSATHGTLLLAGTSITFTPDADFNGTAGFDYTISDGELTGRGHVVVTVRPVNDPPVARDDQTATPRNTPLVLTMSVVRANDSDIDGDTLSVVSVSNPVNGSVVLGSKITFTPATDFLGQASFDYTISDGLMTDSATVTISVVNCVPGTDTDGDRLDDCYETNTGSYVSATDTGTNPLAFDTDGDGLADGDEVLGTTAGLDLPGLGANPLHKDIFIEYDWFDDANDCAPHSHRPSAAELARVTAAFATAPLSNPDGLPGVTMHHDYGQGGLFDGGNVVPDSDGVLNSGVPSREFTTIKTANFATNRRGYFHYVLLPHAYQVNSTSTGQAELSGNDFLVSLRCDPLVGLGNAVMHELGHNLGLRHGGDSDCNLKPNYNSVMNYRYTFHGVDTNCDGVGDDVLDYSRGTNITLRESALDETVGICGAGTTPIDWDGDSTFGTNISKDINADASYVAEASDCGGLLTTLTDFDDWARVSLLGVTTYSGPSRSAATVQPVVVDCEIPRR